MMLTGKMPAVANTGTSLVDVRDVALAHIRALTVPEAAGHRHIINWDCVMFPDIAQVGCNVLDLQSSFCFLSMFPMFFYGKCGGRKLKVYI